MPEPDDGPAPPQVPAPAGAGSGGVELSPEQLRTFQRQVGSVSNAVDGVLAQLHGLRSANMSVGSGMYAAGIVEFYRSLIGGEAAPGVEQALQRLAGVQRAAGVTADAWEDTEAGNVARYQV